GCPRAGPGATRAGTGDRRGLRGPAAPPGSYSDHSYSWLFFEKLLGTYMSIEVANESGVKVDEAALASLARHVLDEMRVHSLAELSVLLVDEPAMTELHVRWMGEEGPTDVLSFPMDELRPPQPGGTHGERD